MSDKDKIEKSSTYGLDPETTLPDGVEMEVVDEIPAEEDSGPDILALAEEDMAAAEARKGDLENSTFERDLTDLLNRYSAESVSGTPDYILANFLTNVLKSYNETVSRRALWRGEFADFDPGRNVQYIDEFTGKRIKSPGDLQKEALDRGEDLPRI